MNVAICVHVFYPEFWPELLHAIDNIAKFVHRADVYVTLSGLGVDEKSRVLSDIPNSKVKVVENRGYDIAPFISLLNELELDSYDLVIKLHTKRDMEYCWVNFRKLSGSAWRQELLSFCNSPCAASRTINAFKHQDGLGMVAGMRLYDPCGAGAGCNFAGADNVLEKIGLKVCRHCAVYGSMFAVRASLLKPFQGKFTTAQFAIATDADVHRTYGLSGDLELAFAMAVEAQGFYIGSGRMPGFLTKAINFIKLVVFKTTRTLSDLIRGRRHA